MTKYLSEEDILLIHHQLIERFGGSHGVRDLDRIRSVVGAVKQTVLGQDQYRSIYEKAAVYARNIIGDHPFLDGNKRTGITSAIIFLQNNGVETAFSKGELEDFAVDTATENLSVQDIATWLREHSK